MSPNTPLPPSRLPARLPAHTGETLNSYITRAARKAHLSERRILQMLGSRQQTLPTWPHVNPPFFTLLSRLAHEPEQTLRERLVDWSEGQRPTRKGNQKTTHHTIIPGRGCRRCRASNDDTRFALAITEFNHICAQHRIWADIDETPGLSGRPASTSTIAAANRYRRWHRKRNPRETALAFNTAYTAIARAHTTCQINAPAPSDRRGTRRIGTSPAPRPHIIEIAYPEIAELASVLLSNQWLNAARWPHRPPQTHSLPKPGQPSRVRQHIHPRPTARPIAQADRYRMDAPASPSAHPWSTSKPSQ